MSTLEMVQTEERIFYYQLLWHYYRGDLLNRTYHEWQQLTALIKEQQNAVENEHIKKAIHLLEEMTQVDLDELEYHYNRLFVGPGRLLASPYESSYRNFEKSIMQKETMLVRNFYHHYGLQVENEGQVPDDHLQFELEFILHLLSTDKEENRSIHRLFLEKHLLQWSDKHIEEILNHSKNSITVAFAYLLKGFLQHEKWMIEGGE